MSQIRFVLISDTHGYHDRIEVPDGDVLLHAGDISQRGKFDQIEAFNTFLGRLPHPTKIMIAGNHDFAFEHHPESARSMITNAIYLQDEAIEVDGIKIYGSPWQPYFHNWAFQLQRGEALRQVWEEIPEDTDILMTHGPPMGIGDRVWQGRNVGCQDLMERVQMIKPKLHMFGHIHEDPGTWQIAETLFVNAANYAGILRGAIMRFNPPIVVDVDAETKAVEVLSEL